ncbi:MAG TPA: MG2 domain-containing protein [Thermoanaerobaculaceae bacterium]|nr:MG2 domain-containing protein [Thermoanaerobaculaceae bacterium]
MSRFRSTWFAGAWLLAAAALAAPAASAAKPSAQPGPAPSARPAGAVGTVVVPDRFLRRWDPLTVFFAGDVGPAGGGPEDHPERLAACAPPHPGAFTWLDARTLQFRPAEPWPPLTRFVWSVGGERFTLSTLMEAPSSTIPADRAEGLDEVDAITLAFAAPVDETALARMVTVELRPLPGIGSEAIRWLKAGDFAVKVMERRAPGDAAAYVLGLATPIPLGTRAIVHLRLALDDDAARSFAEWSFATAEPFAVASVGCPGSLVPVTSSGSRYGREQALRCSGGESKVTVTFTSPPRALGPVEARNLVRVSPAVEGLTFAVHDRTLEIAGRFERETLYRVSVAPTPLSDLRGRRLQLTGASEVYLAFPRKEAYLRWGQSEGVVERFGPQVVPVEGRGEERVDVRIHRIDPLSRSFWPFPSYALTTDDGERPPGPGEAPAPYAEPARAIGAGELARQIKALGSPQVSTLVTLPLRREGGAAAFGLDLAPQLAYAGGKGEPGTYLVGMRSLGTGGERAWMRVQVTDLALATVEEARAVGFVVTSLASAAPVPGARVRVEASVTEGDAPAEWRTVFEGVTDALGRARWEAPGPRKNRDVGIRRIVVSKDADTLVLDPGHPPEGYADNRWSPTRQPWLAWAHEGLAHRGPQAQTLCHIFTERPVYRPEETVHIKGYLRTRRAGTLKPVTGSGVVVVEGPGDLAWRFPVELGRLGGFYHAFAAEKLPTGTYSARFENAKGESYGRVSFRMEAYRIPQFEIQLHAAERVPLDQEFKVTLTATYYAGGQVAARPVRWRVTQFPYAWTPAAREGFLFSSDARYSESGRFESSPRLEREDTTDAGGGASLTLNPAVETTAAPRTYVVEATVTGADDQTVTAVQQVTALPPFVLGLKVPRYLEHAATIAPQVLVIGHDDKPAAGQPVTVRLLHRQWHSVLQASDFSAGKARYLTDVVDEKVFETTVTSGADAITVPLQIKEAGVYLVELESADRLGRSQLISVDLYAGGEEAVSWAKPATKVFTTATDKAAYDPGDTANIVLASPFQKAAALVVIEAPEGNEYRWLAVEGGSATLHLPVLGTWVPELPIHFVLMRGRLPGTAPEPGASADLGKPATMASTAWVKVNPLDNRVDVKLDHPAKGRPGEKIQVKVSLADPHGRPLPGEVTLWLVDAAVLALGKEQRLDPLPDFITPVRSAIAVRDTRNLAFGQIAFAELPGGDRGKRGEGLLERATVRRNFKSVPYYEPAIEVGPDGVVTVTVQLPDNLTNFKLRAKAASGDERFGFAASQVAVRLPVIVQPALPRFVRPGDTLTLAAVGRVVEGEGGPGKAEVAADGIVVAGAARRELTLVPNQPERIEFDASVPTPPYTAEGELAYREATVRFAVERASDGARDAFEVKLPVRDDRERVTVRTLADLAAATPAVLPAIPEAARPGTVRRSLLFSDQPGLVRMAAGLSFLLEYPFGCTEQRVSRARAELAMRRFHVALHGGGSDERTDRGVKETLEWLPSAVDPDGLVGYWPGSRGYVSLTAWVVEFLLEARDAGYRVDPKLLDTLTGTLEKALRSDYSRFIDGEAFAERCWALAALAQAGKASPAYAAELARKAQFLDLEGVAEVLQSFVRAGDTSSAAGKALAARLWDGLVFRLYQGRETYGGLQSTATARNGLVLASETRTVAELTRVLARVDAGNPRLQLLVDALVTLGRGDGWGSTNANAAALLALTELLQPPFAGSSAHQVRLRLGGEENTVSFGPDAPVGYAVSTSPAAGEAALVLGGGGTVVMRAESSYVPAADGSQVAPQAAGFVVSRELLQQQGGGAPPNRIALAAPAGRVALVVGDVVEEHVQVVNPSDRNYVAVVVPLAAGMEPMNPNLATAPAEAKPAGAITLAPTYAAYLDDQVAFYYDALPKGTYDFFFRTRATVAGSYIQPPARAELMYDSAVRGNGAGARVEVTRRR